MSCNLDKLGVRVPVGHVLKIERVTYWICLRCQKANHFWMSEADYVP
jgi:hypothetical protein